MKILSAVILIAAIYIPKASIPQDVEITQNARIGGRVVVMPGRWENDPALDTNVFVFDTNRQMITLKAEWVFEGGPSIGSGRPGTLTPITDNTLNGRPLKTNTLIKIGGIRYVRLRLAIACLVGTLVGTWLGGRSWRKCL